MEKIGVKVNTVGQDNGIWYNTSLMPSPEFIQASQHLINVCRPNGCIYARNVPQTPDTYACMAVRDGEDYMVVNTFDNLGRCEAAAVEMPASSWKGKIKNAFKPDGRLVTPGTMELGEESSSFVPFNDLVVTAGEHRSSLQTISPEGFERKAYVPG